MDYSGKLETDDVLVVAGIDPEEMLESGGISHSGSARKDHFQSARNSQYLKRGSIQRTSATLD